MPTRQVYCTRIHAGGDGVFQNYLSPTQPNIWEVSGADRPEIPFTCTLALVRHLAIRVSVAPGLGKSWTFDLMKNGATTVFTATIADTNTFAELAGCLVLQDGDTFQLRRTPSGSPTNVIDTLLTLTLDQQEPYESFYGFHANIGNFIGVLRASLVSAHRFGSFIGGVRGGINNYLSVAGSVTKYRFRTTVPVPAGGTLHFRAVKNGITQDGSGGSVDTRLFLTAGMLENTWTGNFPVVRGDQGYWEVSYTGPVYEPGGAFGVQFTATTDGLSHVGNAFQDNMPTSGGTYFASPCPSRTSDTGFVWTLPEASVYVQNDSPYTFTIEELWVSVGGLFAGVPLNPLTMTLRQNGATPAGTPTATIAAGAANGVGTGVLTIVPGDTWDIRNVQTGTAGLASLATMMSAQRAQAELWGTCYPEPTPPPPPPGSCPKHVIPIEVVCPGEMLPGDGSAGVVGCNGEMP